MRILLTLFLCLSLSLFSTAQEVRPAPSLENPFHRTSGWTGADGTYSIAVDACTTLWGFSDTFLGDVVSGQRKNFKMVNNSLVLQTGLGYRFLEAPTFRPPDGKGWFWLLDGLHSLGDFEILLGQFEAAPGGAFGFRQIGLWHAKFVLRDQKAQVLEYKKLPHFQDSGGDLVSFGSALYEGPVWTYILGTRDRKGQRESLLARVPRGQLGNAGAWRFFDGKDWVSKVSKCQAIFIGCSMESSLFPTQDGGFLYLGGGGDFLKGEIVARYSKSLTGPWGPEKRILTAPERRDQVIIYNAKAHPQLTENGEILFSYNVNTMDLQQVIDDADIYRPRFYWWKPENSGWLPLGSQ